ALARGIEQDRVVKTQRAAPPPIADMPARALGAMKDKGKSFGSQPSGEAAAADALQLFLAVSGRAASLRPFPAALPATDSTAVVVEGDVSRGDLRDASILDGWSWFPEGGILELRIGPDGSVELVRMLGRWDEETAARARAEAGRLRFSPAQRESRWARLTAAPPN
ncbi:MAG: hypothetical protein JXO51_05590, partial [Candidatus Aminicenantes bacterium]|nr:hypothetical protein [Candidatus Aminicenantes bacterium]